MPGGGDAGERQAVVRVPGGEHPAARKPDVLRRHVQLGCRQLRQLVAQAGGRDMGGTRDGAGKPAGIVAGGDRPGVLRRIELRIDRDFAEPQPEDVGDHLRQDGAVSLSLRSRSDCHVHAAGRIDGDGGRCLRPVLRTRLAALIRRQDRGDVAHVGDRRLDDGGVADAVEPAFRPRLVAARLQVVETAVDGRRFDRRLEVS